MLDPPRHPRRDAVALGLAAGVLALTVLLGAAAWVRLSHGIAVTWRVPTGESASLYAAGERAPGPSGLIRPPLHSNPSVTKVIGTTFERRPVIPTRHRVTARLLELYPFAELGVPKEMPPLDATVEAVLVIPDGPARTLSIDTPNLVAMVVDGRSAPLVVPPTPPTPPAPAPRPGAPVLPVVALHLSAPPVAVTRAFPPGAHRVRISWRGTLLDPNGVGFALRWRAGTAPAEDIPASALTPPPGTSNTLARWVLAAISFVGCLLAWLVFRAARGERDLRWPRLYAVAVVVVLATGATARLYDFQVAPDVFENDDWLFATWNGWSILEDGTTRGWSSWAPWYGNDVKTEKLVYFESDTTWDVITPYLEHPPLMHLMVGAAARIGGAQHWAHARHWHARVVPLLLGFLSLALVLMITRRLAPRGPAAVFAGILYGFVPFIVLQSREVKEEALLVPLLLASLWFFLRWRDDGERASDLALGALCAGLATLTKVPGAAFVPAYVILVLSQPHRPWRAAFQALAVGLGVSLLLFVYGAAIDWQLFIDTLLKQSSGRPTHWNLFPRWIEYAIIDFNQVGRGWLIFLWLAFAGGALTRNRRVEAVLAVPLIAYMVGISLSSGAWTFGWYSMPLHALLCMGAGLFLADLWDEPELFRGSMLMLLLVMYGFNFVAPMSWYGTPASWMPLRRYVAAFVVPALAPFALSTLFRGATTRALARIAVVLGMLLFVGLSLNFIVNYESFTEEYKNFDRAQGFNP